jgi:hypothetical protein
MVEQLDFVVASQGESTTAGGFFRVACLYSEGGLVEDPNLVEATKT